MKTVPLSEWTDELESGARPKGGIKDGVGEVPSLGAEHLADDGGFNFAKDKRIPYDFFRVMKKGHIRPNDILVVKDGATTGKVSFVSDNFPYREAAINEHVFRLGVNRKKADPRFIFRYLQSPAGQQQIMSDFRGATVGGIGRTFLDKVFVPNLALDEQRRIASTLERADSILRKRKQALVLADEFLQSLFFNDFGGIEVGQTAWPLVPMSELATKITDGTHKTPTYVGEGIPFLSAKNIKIDGVDWRSVKYISFQEHTELIRRCKPELGDILLSKSGSLGVAAIVDRDCEFSLFESAALIKPLKSRVDPRFLVSLLNFGPLNRQLLRSTKGVAIKHLHLVDIRSLLIPCPAISEQQRFVRAFEIVNRMKYKSSEYFGSDNLLSSLSNRAFGGEL
jgi:type I restriction enzyme S subunit